MQLMMKEKLIFLEHYCEDYYAIQATGKAISYFINKNNNV